MKCAACKSTEDLHRYHLAPGEITLCSDCLGKLYGHATYGQIHGQRVKAGLAAAKARGVKLGSPIGWPATDAARARGSATMAKKAKEFAEGLRPIFADLAELSANAAARELMRRAVLTARGGKIWTAGNVINIRKRLAKGRGRAQKASRGVQATQ